MTKYKNADLLCVWTTKSKNLYKITRDSMNQYRIYFSEKQIWKGNNGDFETIILNFENDKEKVKK